jgi:hypothetical protein
MSKHNYETLFTIVKKIDALPKGTAYEWVRDEPTEEDISHILKEGLGSPSEFDPLNMRAEMYNDLKEGKAKLVTKRGGNAKVLAIVYPDTKIPWKTFGKIFQAFGKPASGKAASGKPASGKAASGKGGSPYWRLVWFAHPRPREFPKNPTNSFPAQMNSSLHIEPVHLNGGYAYACQPETIVIYREEEVERVLVHELLHASCTDNMQDSVEVREVLTESWAEIFLIAILSGGSLTKAKALWKIQSRWIVDQEIILRNEYNVNDPRSYAWRYTVGRREVMEKMGMPFPSPSYDPNMMIGGSLRFTSPSLTL